MTGVSSAALAAQLPDIAQGLAAAMSELARDPEPSRCEMMAIRLDGARRHCQMIAELQRMEWAGVVQPKPQLRASHDYFGQPAGNEVSRLERGNER